DLEPIGDARARPPPVRPVVALEDLPERRLAGELAAREGLVHDRGPGVRRVVVRVELPAGTDRLARRREVTLAHGAEPRRRLRLAAGNGAARDPGNAAPLRLQRVVVGERGR